MIDWRRVDARKRARARFACESTHWTHEQCFRKCVEHITHTITWTRALLLPSVHIDMHSHTQTHTRTSTWQRVRLHVFQVNRLSAYSTATIHHTCSTFSSTCILFCYIRLVKMPLVFVKDWLTREPMPSFSLYRLQAENTWYGQLSQRARVCVCMCVCVWRLPNSICTICGIRTVAQYYLILSRAACHSWNIVCIISCVCTFDYCYRFRFSVAVVVDVDVVSSHELHQFPCSPLSQYSMKCLHRMKMRFPIWEK